MVLPIGRQAAWRYPKHRSSRPERSSRFGGLANQKTKEASRDSTTQDAIPARKGRKSVNSNAKALTAEGHLSVGRTLAASDLAAAASNRSFETRLEIPSHVGFITPTVERIVRKLRKSQGIPGKESEVRTALYEAIANAVTHGNHENAKKTVRVCCRYDAAQCVSIVVSDEGQGFDPKTVPDPTRPENLESEHGRGIFLMKAYMDEVHYEKGGTEVHLVKKCDGPVQTFVKKLSRFMRDRHRHGRTK